MTTKLEQAARQALEALESCEEDYIYDGENEYECDSIDWDKRNAAITALREALAEQAEQEPVAWTVDGECRIRCKANGTAEFYQEPVAYGYFSGGKIQKVEIGTPANPFGTQKAVPLYAAPVRTKDLTDDELDALIDEACDSQMPYDMFARAVIAADREKNK